MFKGGNELKNHTVRLYPRPTVYAPKCLLAVASRLMASTRVHTHIWWDSENSLYKNETWCQGCSNTSDIIFKQGTRRYAP